MGINYSTETANSVIEQNEFRIYALQKKIESLESEEQSIDFLNARIKALKEKIQFLEAKLEVSKQIFKYR